MVIPLYGYIQSLVLNVSINEQRYFFLDAKKTYKLFCLFVSGQLTGFTRCSVSHPFGADSCEAPTIADGCQLLTVVSGGLVLAWSSSD